MSKGIIAILRQKQKAMARKSRRTPKAPKQNLDICQMHVIIAGSQFVRWLAELRERPRLAVLASCQSFGNYVKAISGKLRGRQIHGSGTWTGRQQLFPS